MIYYEQEYSNEKGQAVIQHHIIDGIPPTDFPEFLGVGYIEIPTPMGPMTETIKVPIQASDLREAFVKFNATMEKDGAAAAKKVVDAIKEKIMAQQKKIIAPASAALPPFRGIEVK